MTEEITNTASAIPRCHTCGQLLTEIEREQWAVWMTPFTVLEDGRILAAQPFPKFLSDDEANQPRQQFYHTPCSGLLNTAETIWFSSVQAKDALRRIGEFIAEMRLNKENTNDDQIKEELY